MKTCAQFLRDQLGATAIEYALLSALIGVVIVGAVKLTGSSVVNLFTSVANNLL
jgi:pilus assembly protein Flp/PilA